MLTNKKFLILTFLEYLLRFVTATFFVIDMASPYKTDIYSYIFYASLGIWVILHILLFRKLRPNRYKSKEK